ncbi:MAG: hypothetical protein LBB86_01685 [Oscillospiraceae bacterium]|jgi:hypothetical protein|nr:hypothetical protein [Oscillospiraceae bacterium]
MAEYDGTLDILCDGITCEAVAADGGECIHDQVEPMLSSLGERAAGLGEVLASLAEVARQTAGLIGSVGDSSKLTQALTRAGDGAFTMERCTSGLACCLARLTCACGAED